MWFSMLLFCILIVLVVVLSDADTERMYKRQEKDDEKNEK